MTSKLSYSRVFINVFFVLLCMLMVLPILLVVSISFTDESVLNSLGYHFIPQKWSTEAYRIILGSPAQLLQAYGVTITVAVIGGVSSLLLTSMLSYSISRRDYRYARITTFYVIFTMLFSGGLVPFYILVTQYLHLKDTIWALIIPYLLNPFYVLIMKGFMDKIPSEIIESAKLDGASEWRIFLKIILPLSTPALATVGLFIVFTYWNDWWLGLLFIDNPKLVPIQLLLYRTMNTIEFLANNSGNINVSVDMSQFPSLSARMALAVLAAGPMMFVFPFFQKHFVKGMTLGSVKG
ncbi:carbohydrate ABC transporter permease [Saccharibacillus brassicae]|uniref:Carbohydrate ABC transporter permease n=1 Tax=Saccharibacillus brassicae TaxID=2583377 RepID=A0A4Y6V3A3_SACBS|nr:carbohydrate ABC transporter permease [Saccharibacillus brassicae]QDH23076.1 carbohydrate ABC transporter permease [Saccharibacillus brassicae]